MKHVVVTGGTRGLGLGLGRAFLALGCRVTLAGSAQPSVDAALAALRRDCAGGDALPLHGVVCDVTASEQLQALWRSAVGRAPVDVWINNAGRNAEPGPFADSELATARAIVDTNLGGVLAGSWVALRGMREQGHGAIYNLEGLGSDGSRWPGLLPYGTSKLAVAYFSKGLAAEAKDSGVLVGTIEPGIVLTDMLAQVMRDPARFGALTRFIEGLAEPPDVVAPRLAQRILANTRSGIRVRPYNPVVLWMRVLLAPLRARRLRFPANG